MADKKNIQTTQTICRQNNTSVLADCLLQWFTLNGRDMPWRVKGKAHENAYAVWISEIMLQQTTVKTVLDYFPRWMQRFPTIEALAQADIDDVLHCWQGLGYYTRAKKIHECAQLIMQKYNGIIPNNRDELLKLPGIGPYTASSICAFAFNLPETVVDGNVIRVIARLYGLTHAVTKEEIYDLACKITPQNHGADYASAIMDLGATVCTPEKPKCTDCPWQTFCIAHQKNIAEQIPLINKPQKKIKTGYIYLIQDEIGAYYIEKRQGKGLLSGLYEFPWQENQETYPLYPSSDWIKTDKSIKHTFTHFQLTLYIVQLKTTHSICPLTNGQFVPISQFKNYAFSTLMKKAIKLIEKK